MGKIVCNSCGNCSKLQKEISRLRVALNNLISNNELAKRILTKYGRLTIEILNDDHITVSEIKEFIFKLEGIK